MDMFKCKFLQATIGCPEQDEEASRQLPNLKSLHSFLYSQRLLIFVIQKTQNVCVCERVCESVCTEHITTCLPGIFTCS